MANKTNWGGKREGAGRHSESPYLYNLTIRLTKENADRIQHLPPEFKTKTEFINYLIEQYNKETLI